MAQEMLLSNLVTETGALGTAQKIGGSSGGGGGGGGTITVQDLINATRGLSVADQATLLRNLNAASADVAPTPDAEQEGLLLMAAEDGTADWEPIEVTRTVSGATPTISPVANTIYNCGELTSLTISNPPATGKYAIIFYSGATATTTVGIENLVAEANKRYKIKVEDNYATYDSWPYTPT